METLLQKWNALYMDQNLPFDIDSIIVFRKVVECRSLSKAAALLAVTKSTVSRKINKLETDLGIKLLRKNTHQITVTDIGEKIYAHALTIAAEVNDIRALVEGSQQEPQGMLRAAIPVFAGIDFASRVGAAFMAQYPKSQLDIRLVDNMVHPVRDGFDVVVCVGPLQDSTLIARKLFTLECQLCASADFLKDQPEPITTPTQLNTLPFIDTGLYGGPSRVALTKGKKTQELAPLIRARANSFQISKQYILQGLGVGVLPQLTLGASVNAKHKLVPILTDWKIDPVEFFVLYPFQLSFSNLISAFFETAIEALKYTQSQ